METTELARAEACAEVRRAAEEAEIKFIRLWFTDVVGRLKSFAITRDELDERARPTGWASTARR